MHVRADTPSWAPSCGPASGEATWNDTERDRRQKRNYAALLLDGGFYSAGTACVAVDSVYPKLLEQLAAPSWLIAFAPTFGLFGFLILPFLTSHWVDRMRSYRSFVVWTSVPQRLAPLFAGVALILLGETRPSAVLWIVALMPVVLGVGSGVNVAALWELVAKVLPPERRASNLSWRNIAGAVLAFWTGSLITAVLTRWPGARGFGVLYLCMGVFMLLSLGSLRAVGELPNPGGAPRVRQGVKERLRAAPRHLRDDSILRRFVLARATAMGVSVLTPFLSIHVTRVLGRPSSFLGKLVAAQMVAVIAGNLLAAWLGDRRGGRILARLGGAAAITLSLGALLNRTETGFLVMFAALGVATLLGQSGAALLQMELFPAERRPSYVGLISLVQLPCMLVFGWVAKELWGASGEIWPAALVALGLLLVSQWHYARLPEPRSGPERSMP